MQSRFPRHAGRFSKSCTARCRTAEFPMPNQIRWQQFESCEANLRPPKLAKFDTVTRLPFYHLHSVAFLEFLSEVTGIPDLVPDSGFYGRGLQHILPGGKLAYRAPVFGGDGGNQAAAEVLERRSGNTSQGH
jgi:hypothetical protein